MSSNVFGGKGSSIDSEQVEAVRRFNRLYEIALQKADEPVHDSRFTRLDLRILRELANWPDGISASWLIERLCVEKAFVSRLFRRLKALRYVEWSPWDIDRRFRNVMFTRLGARVFKGMEERCDDRVRAQLKALTAEERTRLVESMKTIEGMLRL